MSPYAEKIFDILYKEMKIILHILPKCNNKTQKTAKKARWTFQYQRQAGGVH